MGNHFSRQVKEVISFSREEAVRLGNDYISTEHLFLGLIKENNKAVDILKSFGLDLTGLQKRVEEIAVGNDYSHKNSLPLTLQAERIIHGAVAEANALESRSIKTEYLLLGILNNKENRVTTILQQVGIEYNQVLLRVKNIAV